MDSLVITPSTIWDKEVGAITVGLEQKSVFGVTVTNGTVTQIAPTDLGKKYIPSLKKWPSNSPASRVVLKKNNFGFESYAADDSTNADPSAYQAKDMKGWFINFQTSCCSTDIPPNDQIAKECVQLIGNRFAEPSLSIP